MSSARTLFVRPDIVQVGKEAQVLIVAKAGYVYRSSGVNGVRLAGKDAQNFAVQEQQGRKSLVLGRVWMPVDSVASWMRKASTSNVPAVMRLVQSVAADEAFTPVEEDVPGAKEVSVQADSRTGTVSEFLPSRR